MKSLKMRWTSMTLFKALILKRMCVSQASLFVYETHLLIYWLLLEFINYSRLSVKWKSEKGDFHLFKFPRRAKETTSKKFFYPANSPNYNELCKSEKCSKLLHFESWKMRLYFSLKIDRNWSSKWLLINSLKERIADLT